MVVFLFKRKTAYEMRISDWSSDVFSSDLSFELVALIERHIRHIGAFNGKKQGLLMQDFIVLEVMPQRRRHCVVDHAHDQSRAFDTFRRKLFYTLHARLPGRLVSGTTLVSFMSPLFLCKHYANQTESNHT